MAGLGIDFDSSAVEPDKGRDFSLMPTGTKCLMMVTGSEVKATKNNGSMASFELTIIEGQFERRKVWQNMTLKNDNADAVRIGRSQLSALCHAVGHVGQLSDTADLHDKPFVGTLGIEKGKDGHPDKNKVTKFSSVNDASAPQAAQPIGASAAPATAASNPPWKR